MNLIILLILLCIVFILYFGIFPRVLLTFIRRLLLFKIYEKDSSLIIRTYFFLLPFSLFIFYTFFGLKKQVIINSLHISEIGYIFVIFIASFLLIWTFRLAVVMDKTNFLRKTKILDYLPTLRFRLEQQKEYYDWVDQREQMRSFLFSFLFLGVLTSFMIYILNNVVNFTLEKVYGAYSGKSGTDWLMLVFIFIFSGVVVHALAGIGEDLLKKYGIHEEVKKEVK